MRSFCFARSLVASMAFVALSITEAAGQSLQLVGVTNTVWRFWTNGPAAPDWNLPNHDDGAWPTGRGLFGNETGYPYPMATQVNGPGQGGPLTVYYRTRFQVANSAASHSLLVTNFVDDGCVLYLNGVEIARYNMPAETPVYSTSALAPNPGGEPVKVLMEIALAALTNGAPNPLVAGENLLAVEVHQNAASSSDHVFGLSLHVAPECFPGDFWMTDRTVLAGRPTTFQLTPGFCQVETYQWFANTGAGHLPIPGATNPILALPAVQPTDAGTYYCRVTGTRMTYDTRWATLTVIPVVVQYDFPWRYQTNGQDETLSSTPWYAPEFEDVSWPVAPGPFGIETTATTLARLPTGIKTPLPPPSPSFPTAYFRASVMVPPVPPGQTLILCHTVDDGAAFYIDGQLVTRLNLTNPPPILSRDRAIANPSGDGDATIVCVALSVSAGEHLIAAEVHQAAESDADTFFGVELRLVDSPAPLAIAPVNGSGRFRLEWVPLPFWELVESTRIDGPFSVVPNAPTSPHTVTNTGPARFYRLEFNGH